MHDGQANESQVWPPRQDAGPDGEMRHCPHHDHRHCHCTPRDPNAVRRRRKGRRSYRHDEVPAYYIQAGLCEDQRLWISTAHRWKWMAEQGDDLLDEAEREATQKRLTGFAAARAELAHRKQQVRREYLMLVQLAGEPEEPVYEDEVIPLLDQVRYAVDAWHDALVAFYQRRRKVEEVKPKGRRR